MNRRSRLLCDALRDRDVWRAQAEALEDRVKSAEERLRQAHSDLFAETRRCRWYEQELVLLGPVRPYMLPNMQTPVQMPEPETVGRLFAERRALEAIAETIRARDWSLVVKTLREEDMTGAANALAEVADAVAALDAARDR